MVTSDSIIEPHSPDAIDTPSIDDVSVSPHALDRATVLENQLGCEETSTGPNLLVTITIGMISVSHRLRSYDRTLDLLD
jgi:hypothetical protein